MVWGTAGRDRNETLWRTRNRLADPEPVQPQLAQARTCLEAGDQSYQKQTHTQQAEQSHAVCFSNFARLAGQALPRQAFPSQPSEERHPMARWNQ